MSYDHYQYLDISVDDGVAMVLNNDPDRDNAFTPDAHREWAFVYRDLAADEDVRSVVLGAHGRHFSVGPTLEYLQALVSSSASRQRGFFETEHMVYGPIGFDKPVVSAVSGELLGGATTYALMADIIVADRTAVFCDRHVLAGLAPGDGGVLTWTSYAGILKAKRYLLTGDAVPAEEAERIGLITEVVDEGKALERATEYARRMADAPPQAMRNTKRALNQWLRMLAPVLFDQSHALEAASMLSAEFHTWVKQISESAETSQD
jgi:enoyl-CoA hydratase